MAISGPNVSQKVQCQLNSIVLEVLSVIVHVIAIRQKASRKLELKQNAMKLVKAWYIVKAKSQLFKNLSVMELLVVGASAFTTRKVSYRKHFRSEEIFF